MDSVVGDTIIDLGKVSFDVENVVEIKMKQLCIDNKKRSKFKTTPTNHQNPFSSRSKCLKKKRIIFKNPKPLIQPRSLISSEKNTIQTNQNTEPKPSQNDKLMIDINEKMAYLWNVSGYRNMNKCVHRKSSKSVDSSSRKMRELHQNADGKIEECNNNENLPQTCARQALFDYCDSTVVELAAYLDETLFIPKKMSFMAEMMYT